MCLLGAGKPWSVNAPHCKNGHRLLPALYVLLTGLSISVPNGRCEWGCSFPLHRAEMDWDPETAQQILVTVSLRTPWLPHIITAPLVCDHNRGESQGCKAYSSTAGLHKLCTTAVVFNLSSLSQQRVINSFPSDSFICIFILK